MSNVKKNGAGMYTFYGKKGKKGVELITKQEFEILKQKKCSNIFSFSHFGVKTNIDEENAICVLFSKKPNNLTETVENPLYKGVNKPIFINNYTFSKYFTREYDIDKFPNYIKTYIMVKGKDDFINQTYKVYKYAFDIALNKEKEKNVVNLIKALEIRNTLFYTQFRYQNDIFICSTLGILPANISKLFMHLTKKVEIENIKKYPNFNEIINEKDINYKTKNVKINEKETIEKINTFSKKFDKEGKGIITEWKENYNWWEIWP